MTGRRFFSRKVTTKPSSKRSDRCTWTSGYPKCIDCGAISDSRGTVEIRRNHCQSFAFTRRSDIFGSEPAAGASRCGADAADSILSSLQYSIFENAIGESGQGGEILVKYLMILLAVTLLSMGAMRTLYTAPVNDISSEPRMEGGYLVREVIYGSRVIFAASDWKIMPRGYVLDPATGSSFRFAGRAFGSKFKTFFIWGYSVREHQWAKVLNEITDHDEKQARFLREWVDRALRNTELDVFDHLGISHTVARKSEEKAIFYPLVLAPPSQAVDIKHETIGAHRFTMTQLITKAEDAENPLFLETSIYVSGLRYDNRMGDWEFFGAYSHIPMNLPAAAKEDLRRLFLETLRTLSLNPPKD